MMSKEILKHYGIADVQEIIYNPSYNRLYDDELSPGLTGFERGYLTTTGAVAVDTGVLPAARRRISTLCMTAQLKTPSGGSLTVRLYLITRYCHQRHGNTAGR